MLAWRPTPKGTTGSYAGEFENYFPISQKDLQERYFWEARHPVQDWTVYDLREGKAQEWALRMRFFRLLVSQPKLWGKHLLYAPRETHGDRYSGPPDTIHAKAFAEACEVSPKTVTNDMRRGWIKPVAKTGQIIWFRKADIEPYRAILASRRRGMRVADPLANARVDQ